MLTGGDSRPAHVNELLSFCARQNDFFNNMITRQRGLHGHIRNHINNVDTLRPPVLVRETRDFIAVSFWTRRNVRFPVLLQHTSMNTDGGDFAVTGVDQARGRLARGLFRTNIPVGGRPTACPLFYQILDTQWGGSTVQVCGNAMLVADLCAALLGRSLTGRGQFDTWEIAPYFWGLAATGKSLLISIMAAFTPVRHRGAFPPGDDLWATGAVVDTWVLPLDDITCVPVGRGTLCQLISGGALPVRRHGQAPTYGEAHTQLLMASNHPWQHWYSSEEDRDALGRRLAAFEFGVRPEHGDGGMEQEILENDMPHVWGYCIEQYHRLRSLAGDTPFHQWGCGTSFGAGGPPEPEPLPPAGQVLAALVPTPGSRLRLWHTIVDSFTRTAFPLVYSAVYGLARAQWIEALRTSPFGPVRSHQSVHARLRRGPKPFARRPEGRSQALVATTPAGRSASPVVWAGTTEWSEHTCP